MHIRTHIPLLEEILSPRATVIGAQYEAYKNHVCRVLHFCFAFHQCEGDDEAKLVTAACFHDLGMWPGDVIDYLEPSIRLAQEYLKERCLESWIPEITQMIDLHHRFRKAPASANPLVEVFREGDWVDATMGLRRFGLTRGQVKEVQVVFPNLGFHSNLIRITRKEFWKRPLNPLPMMKW
ncbi:MAG: HD domain-containing protein [Verrucomicrobia bacterium]|nr:HD domain-containing protein [Verrucomicrobiota bacterium]